MDTNTVLWVISLLLHSCTLSSSSWADVAYHSPSVFLQTALDARLQRITGKTRAAQQQHKPQSKAYNVDTHLHVASNKYVDDGGAGTVIGALKKMTNRGHAADAAIFDLSKNIMDLSVMISKHDLLSHPVDYDSQPSAEFTMDDWEENVGTKLRDASKKVAASQPSVTSQAAIPVQPPNLLYKAFEEKVSVLRSSSLSQIKVVFLGDTMTAGWAADTPFGGLQLWNKFFAPMGAINMGVADSTDCDVTTNTLLFGMQNLGMLDGYMAKAVILNIGGSNVNKMSAETILEGVKAVVKVWNARQRGAPVLLLGIMPRKDPTGVFNPAARNVNRLLEKWARTASPQGREIRYLDLGDGFLTDKGDADPTFMTDDKQPNEKGYWLIAKALLPVVQQVMSAQQ